MVVYFAILEELVFQRCFYFLAFLVFPSLSFPVELILAALAMPTSTCSLLVGALWATTILGAPTPESKASSKPRSFTIPVIHERSLPADLAERADGAVATYDLGSVYAFKSPVLVGGQQLMLQIDTGSADL